MYAIRRHRAARDAWCWRVSFRRRGKPYEKTFYDLACGGTEEAHMQAIAWRDAQLAQLGVLSIRDFHQQKRSNNASGVPGVHFHTTPAQPRGFWQATIRFHDGKRKARSFSVLKHGEREAFDLAVSARNQFLAEVEDRPYIYDDFAQNLLRPR